jgi:hypothetical protein
LAPVTTLRCLRAAFLGHRVDLVALLVGRVGDHHRLPAGHAGAGPVPVLDHRLRRLRPGVVDVQPVVRLVLGKRRAGFACPYPLPCLALPLVVCAVNLGQLRGGDLPLQLFEEAARADRGELRRVARQQQLAFALGSELDEQGEPVAVGHAGLVHDHDRL